MVSAELSATGRSTIWRPEQRELLFAADYMAIRHIFYYLKNAIKSGGRRISARWCCFLAISSTSTTTTSPDTLPTNRTRHLDAVS